MLFDENKDFSNQISTHIKRYMDIFQDYRLKDLPDYINDDVIFLREVRKEMTEESHQLHLVRNQEKWDRNQEYWEYVGWLAETLANICDPLNKRKAFDFVSEFFLNMPMCFRDVK